MVAQLDPRDWYIKKQKLLYKAYNYIGMQKIQIYENSNCIELYVKCILLLCKRSELDILLLHVLDWTNI